MMSNRSDNNQWTGLEAAVIGMAGRFPGAPDLDVFWENLSRGVESVSFLTEEELLGKGVDPQLIKNPKYVRAAGGILEGKEYFDSDYFDYTPVESEVMDPQIRVFHECIEEAFQDAGYIPERYKGFIGIFAGANTSFYWEATTILSSRVEHLGGFASSLLSNKDLMCSRMAFKFNLRGPCVAVQTACSTSLVAIHMAIQSLLNGECDMAVAGGISIPAKDQTGYMYQEGMIDSPDGHLRAFDKDARGIVGGEGGGCVILKTLDDARRDRDNIHAVIKGSAINNDGNVKSGFTAPSREAQTRVIRMAHRIADIDVESISYIEAHGTGTPLGDPIEAAALIKAFNTTKKSYCAVGSVKTNVGHLDAGAGIAGFIKTVLALKHKKIPPSLNFSELNPQIEFEGSPFFVNTALREWHAATGPLRAGISSFGIGGTNVHMVLQEAPDKTIESPSDSSRLLVLSAKTEAALDRLREKTAIYLDKRRDIALADAAFTLQVGRRPLLYRDMMVVKNRQEAIDGLSSRDSRLVYRNHLHTNPRSIVFIFPGIGSHYAGMGLDLYRGIPYFRREMDRCFELLNSKTSLDLKRSLYPELSGDMAGSPGSGDITPIDVAQIVVFIIEYSLGSLASHWGIKPQAMIGYSFGEYAAACLAGVLSLDDALQLIVRRGELLRQAADGVMLSVPLSESKLQPFIDKSEGISLSIDNGSACIVGGTEDAVASFELEMKRQRLLCMRLPNSRAIHSHMMEPVLEDFGKAVEAIDLKEPSIPYISNVTGTWVKGGEVTNPAYWVRHLRETVRFGAGIKELVSTDRSVFIEIGPGRDTTALVQRLAEESGKNHRVVNVMRRPESTANDVHYLMTKLGHCWLNGVSLDWEHINDTGSGSRISLPTYPFESRHYPVTTRKPGSNTNGTRAKKGGITKKSDISGWFYTPQWKRSSAPKIKNPAKPSTWLAFIEPGGLSGQIAQRLKEAGADVVVVKSGSDYVVDSDKSFTVDVKNRNHFDTLWQDLAGRGVLPNEILFMWGLERKIEGKDCLSGLISLVKAIGNAHIAADHRITALTGGIHIVIGDEDTDPDYSVILAPLKVAPQEYPFLICRNIDIIPGTEDNTYYRDNIEATIREILSQESYPVAALRNGYRWLQHYEAISLKEPRQEIILKKNGTYLVTGGLGNIGYAIAHYLIHSYGANLVLTGLTPLPEAEEWDQWLDRHEPTNKIATKILRLRELRAAAGEVLYVPVDVSDYDAMVAVVSGVERRWGPIEGVIHAAGDTGASSVCLIRDMTDDTLDMQLRPKKYGLQVLSRLFGTRNLDFFLATSSLAPILGGLGFTAYAAANGFMDFFLQTKNRAHGSCWMSVNWADWRFFKDPLQAKGIGATGAALAISKDEGIETFRRILDNYSFDQIVVSAGDLEQRLNAWVKLETVREEPEKAANTSQSSRRPELDQPFAAAENSVQEILLAIWERLFGFGPLGILDNFFELGGDSLKAITVIARIHKELDVNLELIDFFTHPTVRELEFLIQRRGKGNFRAVSLAEKKEYYPVSSAQKRLFILQGMEKESTVYNQTKVMALKGGLQQHKMEAIFARLMERHEPLRTSLELIDDEPVQRVHANVAPPVEFRRVSRPEAMRSVKGFIRPFELARPPLFRVLLLEVGDNDYILTLDIHHLVTDGVSFEILVKEFMALYNELPLPAVELQYKDYAEWQRSRKGEAAIDRQRDYWLTLFSDEIPRLELPVDFALPVLRKFHGQTVAFTLDEVQASRLRQEALRQDATMFMIMLAAYYILLSKLSGQEDVVVGTPTAGRRHADLQYMMGIFVNTLALRGAPMGTKPFSDFLRDVKTLTLEAFENEDFQFEDLIELVGVERDVSRNPLFDVMFVLLNMSVDSGPMEPSSIQGLHVQPFEFENPVSKFDLTLICIETGNTVAARFEYSTELFGQETVRRFIGYYKKIIESILADPAIPISAIELLTEREKHKLLNQFNDTAREKIADPVIHRMFQREVDLHPDSAAIVLEDQNLTYRFVDMCARSLAEELRLQGIVAESVVACCFKRSPEMVIGLLSVLMAGGAYLPVLPNTPKERIRYLLEDSSVEVAVVDRHHADFFEGIVSSTLLAEFDSNSGAQWGIGGDRDGTAPEDLAYIMYTSGSTGKPKGVMIEHRNVARLIKHSNFIDLIPGERLLLTGSVAFDISTFEMWAPLCGGLTLVLIPEEDVLDASRLEWSLVRNRVDILHLIPQLFNQMAEERPSLFSGLSWFLVGGDVVRPQKVNDIKRMYPALKIVHMYGPTENTTFSTFYRIQTEDSPKLPIGTPLINSSAFVLDRYMNLVPIGCSGELWVGGDGVGRGYLNHPELTEEKFRTDAPFTNRRLYRTGDLACFAADGNIEFLGRVDQQIKIRGIRIELGEVELQILKSGTLKEAVVMAHADRDGEKFLAAYIVPNDGISINIPELKKELEERIPSHMIPSFFMILDRMPLNRNGKVDRKALPVTNFSSDIAYVAPGDETERQLVEIWAGILKLAQEKIGIDSNFFHLGGHSLKATVLAGRIHKFWQVKLPLAEIFKNPTIRGIATIIRNAPKGKFSAIAPAPPREYYPLSPAQRQVFVMQQMDSTGTAYNMPQAIDLAEAVDMNGLELSFRKLIQRHESLRTGFFIAGGQPVQKIFQSVDFQLEYIDASCHNSDYVMALMDQFVKPFDLEDPPLMRAAVFKTGESRFVLMFDVHHIVADGGSLDILVDDFLKINAGGELNPVTLHYKDFAYWQQEIIGSNGMRRQEEYWLGRFRGVIPRLDLPLDFPRPDSMEFDGRRLFFKLQPDLAERLKSAASDAGGTMFMILLAIYAVVLSKVGREEDIVIGCPVAGRNHADLERAVGMFVNMLPLRISIAQTKPFLQLVREVRQDILAAFDNQNYPFESLVNKLGLFSSKRNPLFDVAFDLHDLEPGEEAALSRQIFESAAESVHFENKTAKFDLSLDVRVGKSLICIFEYATGIFKEETIECFKNYFCQVAQAVSENPMIEIGEIQLAHDLLEPSGGSLMDLPLEFNF